jgi:hypothetical protein
MRSMSWDETFADRYEEWSAPMTADVAFYVGLARAVEGPLVELAIGIGRVALYGGFDGEPFTGESREYVFVARHRGASG